MFTDVWGMDAQKGAEPNPDATQTQTATGVTSPSKEDIENGIKQYKKDKEEAKTKVFTSGETVTLDALKTKIIPDVAVTTTTKFKQNAVINEPSATPVDNMNNSFVSQGNETSLPLLNKIQNYYHNPVVPLVYNYNEMRYEKEPLIINTDELDFSYVRQRDLNPNKDSPNEYSINLANPLKFYDKFINDMGQSLGSISLTRIKGNIFKINDDLYDFDIREWSLNTIFRNIETIAAGIYRGGVYDNKPLFPSKWSPTPFRIIFIGTVTIEP